MTLLEHWQETIFSLSVIIALWAYISHRFKLIEIHSESIEMLLLGPEVDDVLEEALEP